MSRAQMKSPAVHQAVAKAIAGGATIKDALLDNGYSQAAANKGRAGLTGPLKAALAVELGEKYAELVAEGRKVNTEELRAAVIGRLQRNLAEGSDAGVQTAKLAGQWKELDMWKAENLTGVIIVEAPRSLPSPDEIPSMPVIEGE